MKLNKKLLSGLSGSLLGLVMGIASTAQAANLALETSPLFLSNQADPNVFFEIDDSGSMDWEILAKPHISPGFGTTLSNGLMYEGGGFYEIYLYQASDNAYANNADSTSTDWRARCSCLNVLAYDPSITYRPWAGYADADITASFQAKSDPHPGTAGYSVVLNLSADTYYTNWIDTNSDGVVDLGEAKTTVATSSLTTVEQQNYANWFQYHRRRSFVAKGAVASVVDNNPGFRYGLSVINNWGSLFVTVPSASTTNYTSHNNSLINSLNILDWPAAGTPLRSALKRTGDYFDDTLSGKPDPIISECQKNFAILFTDGYWNGDPSYTNSSTSTAGVGDTDGDGHFNTLADFARRYYNTDLSPLPDNVPPDTFDTNPRQHMVTFTVAFGINGLLTDTDSDSWPNPALTEAGNWGNAYNSNAEKVDDLWHSAFNAKGTFIAAQTPQDVADSLNAALANISSRTSSAASVALNAGSIGANSRVYQAKFDTEKWSGQVLSFTVSLAGAVSTTPNWDAGCKMTGGLCPTTGGTETGQNWDTGRNIITYKPSNGDGIPFRWPATPATPTSTELDVNQTSALDIDFATSLADGNAMLRWQYIRGDRSNETTTFRTRDSVLGDVIHSAPVYVGPPSFNYPDSLESADYSTFRSTYQNRQPIVWFGANDGLFHGVDASLVSANQGKEVIAYVPSQMFNHLHELTSSSYIHRYYVDGVPSAGDVFFGSSWKTVIVSGLAAGGQGLFALDVTNPSTFTEANANSMSLWEFTDTDDRDMGYSYGQPSIVKLQNGVWAAIFGNGYGNTHDDDNDGGTTNDSLTGNSVIYIVNIQTGALIRKFDTGVGSSADPLGASRPNGMSSPTIVDVDNDKKADFIFAGDLFGNLWKIDISDPLSSNWKFDYSASSPHTPLFVTNDGSGTAQPITTSPEVSKHTKGGFLVNVGTGKYIETGDNSQIGQQTQTFYGIWDKNNTALTVFNRSHLLQQIITEEESEDFDIDQDGTRSSGEGTSDIRETTKTPITWHTATGLPTGGSISTGVPTNTPALGWYVDLYNTESGNTNNYGERQVTDSTLIDGVIFFNTLIPSANPCDFGGDSWIMALKVDSGERVDESVFDLDHNGVFDAGDGFDDVSNTRVSGVKSFVGILPRLTFAKGYGGDSFFAFGSGSSGGFMTQQIKRSGTSFGRQSWDQIIE
ncbi:MAG: pilus assembly protein [Piscirickettsiaceae bacterium]|nr:MAG: pilus assembly protein [Piscirickettsiaceae bacterium]PCI65798.1 MAG: pilus assembly protein [Piscirickettsiaceae bacterium]